MEYKHKSGAKKRNEKKLKDVNAKKGQQTLDLFRVIPTEQLPTEQTIISTPICVTPNAEYEVPTNENAVHANSEIEEREIPDRSNEETALKEKRNTFDIGTLEEFYVRNAIVKDAVIQRPQVHPVDFPDDCNGLSFPKFILHTILQNGEKIERDWLAWSKSKNALFCFPCRLFSKLGDGNRSALAKPSGYSVEIGWKKLYDRIPEHENSKNHRECYVNWRQFELEIEAGRSIDLSLKKNIESEAERWRQILHRLLDVVLFLGERGLAFRGSNHLIGDPQNGNFLGILELISHYDPLLNEHLQRVKEYQTNKTRLQVHYLSPETQNEFIECCANEVVSCIRKERDSVKYYSIIIDATPDSAHIEQTVFILRYVLFNEHENQFKIQERFLEFADCNNKTGEAISELIRTVLEKHNIPLADCRGQGYDNGSNMSGRYKGVQSHILKLNPLAIFSPCACHSLNLCGVQAAECCPEAIKFFGSVQKLYNIFSSSPQRWAILKERIGSSLHSMSKTRWSARVDCIKPFAANIPGIIMAIDDIETLNLTSETKTDLKSLKKYMQSFECSILASIWIKILTAINQRNLVLQARNSTVEVEMANIKSLINELKSIRNLWLQILEECKIVTRNAGILSDFREKRRKIGKKSYDEANSEAIELSPDMQFKQQVFYVICDCLIGNMTKRFQALTALDKEFGFLYKYKSLNDSELKQQAQSFCERYQHDVSTDLLEEMIHLKTIHEANFGAESLSPMELLNTLKKYKLESIFPNICVALRIFCTIPVSVAEGERAFSLLSRVKNFLRSTMLQSRLSSLGTLAIESNLAKKIDFGEVINKFATKKARKVFLK